MSRKKGSFASRRTILKWSLGGLGVAALASLPTRLTAQPAAQPSTGITSNGFKVLTFSANDIGILNFALLLEELEAAFYAAVIQSGRITDPREIDYIRQVGAHEAEHVRFLRNTLEGGVVFQTEDLVFNQDTLRAILADRNTILNTAVALEDLGVHTYNGAGPSLRNPTFLLAAGSIVSVEGRHAASIRALLELPVTETTCERAVSRDNLVPELNPFIGSPYDELYTFKQVLEIVRALNILRNPINGKLFA